MRQFFAALTRQQRLIIGGVFALNAVIMLGLLGLLLTDVPPQPLAWPDIYAPCEANVALRLRQQGVAASVTITQSAMLVTVNGPTAQAWDVFSVTTRLAQTGCGPYNLIRVDVPDPEARPNVRLVLELTGLELQYWADGVLSDGQLADRMRRQVYVTADTLTPTPP